MFSIRASLHTFCKWKRSTGHIHILRMFCSVNAKEANSRSVRMRMYMPAGASFRL